MMEEIWRRAAEPERLVAESQSVSEQSPAVSSEPKEQARDWKSQLQRTAEDEISFTEQLLAEGEREGGLLLAVTLGDLDVDRLEAHFVELMARDLEDYRALEFAGRILEEIARREPELGVALLSALSPAEKERLVPSVAKGWTLRDPAGAFDWIGSAWIEADGDYIDRALQNDLYVNAMDALVGGLRDYGLAAETLLTLKDPELKKELTELVAHRIVRDGPENALDRLVEMETAYFDTSVMDEVAEQWAARDGVGAAAWVLENESEMSSSGVRSIAKQLTLGAGEESLAEFHRGLATIGKRDAVAAEAARLKARREPYVSADWVSAIERPEARRAAVFDALYEIGYEDFTASVNYIDIVYESDDVERVPVVYSTLKDWVSVDLDAVAGYLGSGRANLSAALSEELLLEMEARLPQG
ncbi:hypothetical protein JIN87_27145 [Pelagicoccus mobilis]|uniref:Uncharacterized protein n=2 Tax=Pelagicoccus mobilis TaxID=415221 RepID=A0A934S839_9BACT|nr:hypothetical protein [Pelagicoccus mobilis]